MPALNSKNIPRPTAIAMSVLSVWCTTTLSMTTWVPIGMVSPISWMKKDASSTSRQTRLCRNSSVQNQRKPNFVAAGAPSSVAGSFVDSCRTSSTSAANCSLSDPSSAVCGAWLPATK